MHIRLSITLAAFVLFIGCERGPSATSDTVPPTQPVPEGSTSTVNQPGNDPVTSVDVKREIREAFDAARDYTAQRRDELGVKLQEKKDFLDRKIMELDEKSTAMTQEAKADWARDKVVIQQKKAELEARLEELKKSSEPAWQDLKEGTSKAWNEFQDAVENAASHFQSDKSVK
jgi:hypothetical protein